MSADAANVAIYFIAFAFLTYEVAAGRSTVGDYVVTIGAVMQLQNGLQTLVRSVLSLQEEAVYAKDLFDLLERAPSEQPGGGQPIPSGPDQAIRLDGVSFAYLGAVLPAVCDLNLNIRTGERIAIVGPNGSGKTTLVKLLLGLYPPTSGAMTMGGAPVSSLDRVALRRSCSAVFQNFVRYEFTVRENIGLGDVERIGVTEAILEASSKGGADEVADLLPDGYQTVLGKSFGGVDLSGGQWQRLAISRAMMRHRSSRLIVLDEPTAGLDPTAEADVFERFAALSAGKATLLVFHRLGSARLADRILYLEGGRVLEVMRNS